MTGKFRFAIKSLAVMEIVASAAEFPTLPALYLIENKEASFRLPNLTHLGS
jgi:hypothetical protein